MVCSPLLSPVDFVLQCVCATGVSSIACSLNCQVLKGVALRELILQILENCVPCKGQYDIVAENLQFQEILNQSSCVVLLILSALIHVLFLACTQLLA